jgi:hypothetical protein
VQIMGLDAYDSTDEGRLLTGAGDRPSACGVLRGAGEVRQTAKRAG